MPISRRARRLAAPIVVTVAAAPACAPAQTYAPNPPWQQTNLPPANPPPIMNPPPPTTIATPPVPIANPPPQQIAGGLPLPSGNGRVEQRPDGTCVQYAPPMECPKGMSCNPPPPHPVQCPSK